jgi:hypothetical protein
LDESTYTIQGDHFDSDYGNIAIELKNTLSPAPSKGFVNIEIPTLSPIAHSKRWNNADSIHSYLPAEFTSRITDVHYKREIVVHEVLRNFREGTILRKVTRQKNQWRI